MNKGKLAVLSATISTVLCTVIVGKIQEKEIERKKDKVNKFKTYYYMMNEWLMLKQNGKSLEKYFLDSNYKSIAIYGMGEIGHRLYDELKGTSIDIKYAVDKEPSNVYSEIEVKEITDEMEAVDAIVVTAIFALEKVKKDLEEKVNCPIVSLEDIVYKI